MRIASKIPPIHCPNAAKSIANTSFKSLYSLYNVFVCVRTRRRVGCHQRFYAVRFLARRPLSFRAEGIVAAAGPIANLTAAAILFLLVPLLWGAREYLVFSAVLQLSSALWNLLPIADLDGARILSCLLSRLPLDTAEVVSGAVSGAILFIGLTLSLGILYFSGAAFYTSLAFFLLLLATP